MSGASWHSVKPKVLQEIEKTKDMLTSCEPDELIPLQSRVQALKDLFDWFEGPQDDARKISDPGGY